LAAAGSPAVGLPAAVALAAVALPAVALPAAVKGVERFVKNHVDRMKSL
jgi:hypothetical protein